MEIAMRSLLLCGLALLSAVAPARGRCQSVDPGQLMPGPGDASPHRVGFVTRSGVRLHYLEWGTSGPVVVLLPGYALTAHAFDDVGRLLASDFRVIAVTPRGFGESDAPDSAEYTIRTMVADLTVLLDSLGIDHAALVGHSISGATIAEFARAHPARVTKLVFLDAFPYFAAAGGDSIDALSPVKQHAYEGEMTYARFREFLRRYRFSGWSAALEANLRANTLGAELTRRRALTDGYVRDQRDHPPDLRLLTVPALQVCAIPTVATEYPWVTSGTPLHARAGEYVRDVLQPFDRQLCTRFAAIVPQGHTLEVTGSHYVFFTKPNLTARVLRQFLQQ
jgi:pimeloyl-ACP methyl ester carboxylesterase